MIVNTIQKKARARGFNTVAELAKASGISDPTIRRLWHGSTFRLDFETLDKLCATLKCNVGNLLIYKPNDEEAQGDNGNR